MIRRRDPRFAEVGARLLPTADAIIHDVANERATLVGFSRDPDCIRVVRDGHKTPEKYHYRFWRRAQTNAEKAVV